VLGKDIGTQEQQLLLLQLLFLLLLPMPRTPSITLTQVRRQRTHGELRRPKRQRGPLGFEVALGDHLLGDQPQLILDNNWVSHLR